MPKGVYERSPELREALRERARKLVSTPESQAKGGMAGRGRPKSESWKKRMSGPGNGRYRHGMARTPTWRTWVSMRTRCLNPRSSKYPLYGGRGVTICDEWMIFENFFADMGKRPDGKTIDRIDPEGNYEPSNCRWATPREQRLNQRPKATR